MFTLPARIDAPKDAVDAPPSPGHEIELKFLVDEATFKAAQASPVLGGGGRGAGRRIETTYFDTQAGDLRRNRVALRVRRARRGYVMGLKWSEANAAAAFSRPELEIPTTAPTPDVAGFGEGVRATIADLTEGRPLQAMFVTDVRRAARIIRAGGSEIEVAFDKGFVSAGERREPLREVELELKSGDPADLYRFGLALLDMFPLRLGMASKAERGAMLLSQAGRKAVRASEPSIAPEQTVDEVIVCVFRSCVQQFAANWSVFEEGDAAEAVHQMRVSMRRLRSALALFQREAPCAEFDAFRAEAKRFASTMGEAREWDVFCDLIAAMKTTYGADEGFDPMLRAAAPHREAGHAVVRDLIHGADPTRFVLASEEFIARRGWRNAVAAPDLARLANTATSFAGESLERLDKRVRKRGKHLLDLSPPERHRVRIALKNLRYAGDFFATCFDRPNVARRYLKTVARLQDVLGGYNDASAVADHVRRLDLGGDLDMARAAGAMMGWHSRGASMGDATLADAWSDFRKEERFWRD